MEIALAAFQEVIPMRKRSYAASRVNDVDAGRLVEGKEGVAVTVGIDVGKHKILAVCRWADGSFERPWRINNPSELAELVTLLRRLRNGRKLVVALESSGTYGDALRQALADGGLELQRVGTKAAHDYAEAFDGVPSQHDGKDAAVIAELAAMGKGVPWPYQPADAWNQELAYWVEWMVSQRQVLTMWQGRLEGLLARHWPEATRVLKLSSVTLLKVLGHYGSAQALSADPAAATRLARWGGKFLDAAKIERFVAEAWTSQGVRPGDWQRRQIQDCARQALQARQHGQRSQCRLRVLARAHSVLQAQGKVVGLPTACVLWVNTGDPRKFYAAAAYRKAMGLNLVERSSGEYQGRLHISKRGSARSRQWLYFAVLRLVQKAGVRSWYEAKKARDPEGAKSVLVALMRKLALALYQVGAAQQEFDVQRLFTRIASRVRQPAALPAANEIGIEA
jgi:transposase